MSEVTFDSGNIRIRRLQDGRWEWQPQATKDMDDWYRLYGRIYESDVEAAYQAGLRAQQPADVVRALLQEAHDRMDNLNASHVQPRTGLCHWCGATTYDGRHGILHDDTCIILRLRHALAAPGAATAQPECICSPERVDMGRPPRRCPFPHGGPDQRQKGAATAGTKHVSLLPYLGSRHPRGYHRLGTEHDWCEGCDKSLDAGAAMAGTVPCPCSSVERLTYACQRCQDFLGHSPDCNRCHGTGRATEGA